MKKRLSWLGVSAIYIGVIMGAGFASGRECWQFFGVFGRKGFLGSISVTISFLIVSFMLTYVSLSKNTTNLGKVISPVDNMFVIRGIRVILAITYYSMLIAMTAAGGSILKQQFGLSKVVGGAIIGAAILITVLGDFSRISKVFKFSEPIMISIAIITILTVILNDDISQSGMTEGFEISEMTPNWLFGSILFVSYNSLGMITISSDAAINAKNKKHAFYGAAFASILLGAMTIVLLYALQKDMAFSDSMDMPMLGYSMRINKVLNILYTIVLCFGVYSTGSGTYYAFSSNIPSKRYKTKVLVIGAIAGYAVGLTGFKEIVSYLYPLQGYFGIVILTLVFINFIMEIRNNRGFAIPDNKNQQIPRNT